MAQAQGVLLPATIQDQITRVLPSTCSHLLGKPFPVAKLFVSNSRGAWEDPHITGAAALVVDRSIKAKFLRIYDILSFDVLFEAELACDIELVDFMEKVATYELPDCVVALNFSSVSDKDRFLAKVNSNIPKAQDALGKPTKVKKRRKKSLVQRFKGLFSRHRGEEEKEVGEVFEVQHRGTVTLDSTGSLDLSQLPPEFYELMKPVLRHLNVSKKEFKKNKKLQNDILKVAVTNKLELQTLANAIQQEEFVREEEEEAKGGREDEEAEDTVIVHEVIEDNDNDVASTTTQSLPPPPSSSLLPPPSTSLPPPPTTSLPPPPSTSLPPPPSTSLPSSSPSLGLPPPPSGLPDPSKVMKQAPAGPPGAADRSDLMAAIRNAKPLAKKKKKKSTMTKKTASDPPPKPAPSAGGGLYGQLFAIVAERRKSLAYTPPSWNEDSDSESDWSD